MKTYDIKDISPNTFKDIAFKAIAFDEGNNRYFAILYGILANEEALTTIGKVKGPITVVDDVSNLLLREHGMIGLRFNSDLCTLLPLDFHSNVWKFMNKEGEVKHTGDLQTILWGESEAFVDELGTRHYMVEQMTEHDTADYLA